MARRISVELGERRYDIHIDTGCRQRAGELIAPHLHGGRSLVVADETVAGLYGQTFTEQLNRCGVHCELATFPAGEEHKSLASADRLWQACAAAHVDRSGAIIALGGGVTGDLAGFVAATWMRGVRFVQVPTTLLAMVDSSVGGKTGINSAAGKNLIGAFQQPCFVLIDPQFVASMEQREYAAGLAEVVKYGVIRDAEFFAWQEHHAGQLVGRDPTAVGHAVAVSCAIKAWYVAADEHENGVRAHLNYGHTFGHALERETNYGRYLHGEAVSIGMRMAAELARLTGRLTEPDLPVRLEALLSALNLPLSHRQADPRTLDHLVNHCRLDKKVRKGSVRFVLPSRLGHVDLVAGLDEELVRQAFAAGLTHA